jgi:hypothetical protein
MESITLERDVRQIGRKKSETRTPRHEINVTSPSSGPQQSRYCKSFTCGSHGATSPYIVIDEFLASRCALRTLEKNCYYNYVVYLARV